MSDPINPSYYADHVVSPIDLMDAYGMAIPFCLGNVIKYVARHSERNGLEDLKKAKWYLDWAIQKMEGDAK